MVSCVRAVGDGRRMSRWCVKGWRGGRVVRGWGGRRWGWGMVLVSRPGAGEGAWSMGNRTEGRSQR